jgi:hypothetical protein
MVAQPVGNEKWTPPPAPLFAQVSFDMLVCIYADLPQLRAWRAGSQLDIAGVFAVRRREPALSILF